MLIQYIQIVRFWVWDSTASMPDCAPSHCEDQRKVKEQVFFEEAPTTKGDDAGSDEEVEQDDGTVKEAKAEEREKMSPKPMKHLVRKKHQHSMMPRQRMQAAMRKKRKDRSAKRMMQVMMKTRQRKDPRTMLAWMMMQAVMKISNKMMAR